MSKILGIGNALVDIIVPLESEALLKKHAFAKGSQEHVDKEKFDAVYSELALDDATQVAGGSAANVLHSLANLGHKATFVGVIGNDDWGEMFEKDMQAAGVHFDPIRKEGDTGKVLHLVTPDQKKTVIGYTGVNDQLGEEDLQDHYFSSYTHLVLDGYLTPKEDFLQSLLEREDLQYARVVFDMSSSHIAEGHREFLKRMIKNHVDVLFANDLEAFSYTGNEPERGIRSMAKDCDLVVVKKGSSGSMIQRGAEFYNMSAAPARVSDTIGAGDMYAAGFLYGLLKNYHLTHCGKIASFLASKVLEVEGARISSQRWHNLSKMI
jgi:sugar/nucleoside kinase (ribokinase family)